jgi:beta-aspartyl-peptidase (threonine type)
MAERERYGEKRLLRSWRKSYLNGLEEALDAGYKILQQSGTALDAVEAAVVSLENCPLFNAGKGSVFTADGKHEMDACVMDGSRLTAGAVANVTGVKNPILLARRIMEKTEHVLLAGKGAEDFARSQNLPFENEDYFYNAFRYEQWQQVKGEATTLLDHSEKKFGTVGAVAVDSAGNLAAATSTGGMTNKRFGRIGDTALIGCGTYADNHTCAVSCTGHGEFFIRAVVAYDVACLMKYRGLSLAEACRIVVQETLKQSGGEGGLVAVDQAGNVVLEFNSEGMYRGSIDAGGKKNVAIYMQ